MTFGSFNIESITPRAFRDTAVRGEYAGYKYVAPDRGATGITVYPPAENGERPEAVTLPGIAGRYQRGAGLVYRLPTSWGEYYPADAVEVEKGEAWTRIGEDEAAQWSKKSPYRKIWQMVAAQWPIEGPSPRVTEGVPPLAPDLAPLMDSQPTAREAWAMLAERLTPTGRAVVGLALTSPWIDRIGATSSVVSLWGEAGEGKSLLARVCAALYGDPEDGETLFGTFNSSGQGLTAHAQDLSYYPVIVDEAQSATADVEPQLIALAMGAQRKRSSRSGAAVKSPARWGGLVIVTGNAPLGLRHEMFSRRLIEVQVSELWDGAPDKNDWDARAAWWADIAQLLPIMAGWPWKDFSSQFEPGQPSAKLIAQQIHSIPMPGAGNLGFLGRLAVFGCEWLSTWTNADWSTGVWEAMAQVIADSAENAFDPARDAARQIIESFVTQPGAWTPAIDSRDTYGYRAEDLSSPCGITHEGHCEWTNIFSFPRIVDVPLARLGRTPFRRALYTPEKNRLTRKVRQANARVRAVTACLGGLAELAEPTLPASLPEQPPESPQLEIVSNIADAPTAQQVPEQCQSNMDTPEEENQKRVRVFGHTEDNDVDRALDWAVSSGYTDIVVPQGWIIQHSGRWDARDWFGQGSGQMYREDGETVRVWPIPHGRTTPAEYAEALVTFREGTDLDFITVPTLGHKLVMDHESGKDPRWKLPEEQAELWTPDQILHPRQWGNRDNTAVTQYDRNRSYLGAITQANVAPLYYGEDFEHYGADAPVDRSLGGMYRIEVPNWNSPLPAPHATAEAGDEFWTTPEIMRLYQEQGVSPRIIEAWLAPARKIPHLHALAEQCKNWLADYADSPARMIPKAIYQSIAGSMTSEHFRGRQYRVYRPDWGNAIADNSWANVVRRVYKIHAADQRFIPTRVNVDAIYYPSDLPTPPGMPLGDGLGQFKIEG